jgi:CubicO group peptidase (beta-lactamase class C family)
MLNNRKSFTIWIFIVFVCLFSGILNEIYSQDKAATIDGYISRLTDYGQFNGSLLVAEDGDVILKKGYGYANMDWEIPNTPDTKFRIGSLTKQFVAMLIMQLVEEGKIELQGKLSDYVPEYRKDTGQKITIHHLLTHTSGIPSFTNIPGFWSDSTQNSYNKNYMIKEFHSGDLMFEPGTEYYYNNSGYFLLAIIIEHVTGKTFEENLHERILKPANMLNTGVDRNVNILKKKASGYFKRLSGYINEPYFYMLNVLGAGDMYSTVEDLYLWDQALYDDELLSEKYKNIMFTPVLKNYAYGWGIYYLKYTDSSDSLGVVAHSGSINGFNAQIFRLIEDEHLIVILNNTGQVNLWDMCLSIINILYDRSYALPKKSIVQTLGKTILTSGIKYALIQYHLLKTYKFAEYDFNEKVLNILGYQLISINRISDAVEIFKLNIEEYPKDYLSYNSLGSAYLLAGRERLAIKSYMKSLELNPDNVKAVEMIEKIKQSK